MKTIIEVTAFQARHLFGLEIVPARVRSGLPLPAATAAVIEGEPHGLLPVELWFRGSTGHCYSVVSSQMVGMGAYIYTEVGVVPTGLCLAIAKRLLIGAAYTIETCAYRHAYDIYEDDNGVQWWGAVVQDFFNHIDRRYTQAVGCRCCRSGYRANPNRHPIRRGDYDDDRMGGGRPIRLS